MAGAATSQQALAGIRGGLPPPQNFGLTYATAAADPYWTWTGAGVTRRFGGSIVTTSSTGNLFRGGAIGVTGYAMSFVDGQFSTAAGDTKTFTDFPIGAEHADRWVLCAYLFYNGGGAQSGNPTATIGGVAATIIAQDFNTTSDTGIVFFTRQVPTGTIATISITWGQASNRAMLASWRLLNWQTPTYTQSFMGGTPGTLNVSGNFAIASSGIRRASERYTASAADAIP